MTRSKNGQGQPSLYLVARITVLTLLLSMALAPMTVQGGLSAGFSEYYIPGATQQLWDIFEDLDNDPDLVEADGMHSVIAVTAFTDGTTVYYDHWENGYGLDPSNLAGTADEIRYSDRGTVHRFESSNVPVDPRGTGTFYDGRDRIYVAGGPVSVTRASWPESIGTVFALAWELYPVKPFLRSYTIPVGQDLFAAPTSYVDFERVFVIAQSVADGNTVQIDDPSTAGVDVSVVLNQGEVTQLYSINSGTVVTGSSPVQVQFIVGRQDLVDAASEIRGYTAVPAGLWSTEYYSPVGGFVEGLSTGGYWVGRTNLYLYNPHPTTLTIFYEDTVGSGSFDIPAGSTRSYAAGTGRYVPRDSGVYLRSTAEFWGIGAGDSESLGYDWGYSLVPAFALTDEYFLGWAPGSNEPTPTVNGSPVFITPVQDDTTVYVDYSPADGVVDATYVLDRLNVQKVFDPDFDNTGMHIVATGPLALAWGEDVDTADPGNPYLDLGYTVLPPYNNWMDEVLGLVKTVDPTALPMGPGNAVTVTLSVPTYAFVVDNVVITDTLSPGWSYLADSTLITWPDGTVISGTVANPAISGQELVWAGSSILPSVMPTNEILTVAFVAQTTITTPGGYNINQADATGTYNGDTFTSHDSAWTYLTSLTIDKDTSTPVVRVGEVATYTIVVNSNEMIRGAVITDALPSGFSYREGSIASVNVTRTSVIDPSPGDTVLTWGTWDIAVGGALTITFSTDVNAAPGTYDNDAVIDSPTTGPVDDAGTAAQDAGTPSGRDPEPDEDVTVIQPTAIELLYLRAIPQPGSVLLEWETAVEIDNYGFYVLRSTNGSLDGAEQIGFVPAAGLGSGGGAAYTFEDRSADPGTQYSYWLVDADTGGLSTVHGPVTALAMPNSGAGHTVYLPTVMR